MALVVLFQALVAPSFVASQALVATFLVLCQAFEAPSSTFWVVEFVWGAELSLELLDWLQPVTATAVRAAKSNKVFFISTFFSR